MTHYSSAAVRSEHASKYLQQLCKHFAHKVEVSYDQIEGQVHFPMGLCLMKVEADILMFAIRAESEEAVKAAQSVIDVHLVKFAWREDLTIEWAHDATADWRKKLEQA